MVRFRCSNCNYVFKDDKMPKRCPYCAEYNCIFEEKSILDALGSEEDYEEFEFMN